MAKYGTLIADRDTGEIQGTKVQDWLEAEYGGASGGGGAPTDTQIAALVNSGTLTTAALNSRFDSSYSAKPSSVVMLAAANGTDDSSAINAAVAANLGKTLKGVPGSAYKLGSPIVLRSGSSLDMTGCSVTLTASTGNMVTNLAATTVQRAITGVATTAASTTVTSTDAVFTSTDIGRTVVIPNAGGVFNSVAGPLVANIVSITSGTTVVVSAAATDTVAAGTGNIYNRDSSISITGGSWDRGSALGAGPALHSIMLRRIDKVTVSNLSFKSAAGKYSVNLGDVTKANVHTIDFAVDSDGVHFNGPAADVTVRNITGFTGDDSVAFTARDYQAYNDVQGDIAGVLIDGVRSTQDDAACVKIIGGTGVKLTDIIVRNVQSKSTVRGVAVIDDLVGTTDITNLLIDGVNVNLLNNGNARAVDIQVGNGKNAIVRNVSYQGVSTILIGVLTGVWESVVIDGLVTSVPLANTDMVRTGGACTSISVSNVVGRFSDSLSNVFNTGTGTVLGRAVISNVDIVGGRCIFSLTNVCPQIIASNINLKNGSRLANISITVDLTINNLAMDTLANAAIYVSGTGNTVWLRGSGVRRTTSWSGLQLQTNVASQPVRCYNPDYPVDIALLQNVADSAAQNTSTTVGGGAGKAISDGTNWFRQIAPITGRIVTAAATMTAIDQSIVFNSASAITQALITAATAIAFKKYTFTNINTGTVTFSDTISGQTNRTLSQYSSIVVYSTGTAWVIDQDYPGVMRISGNGNPESAVTAPIGSHYIRKDGGLGNSFYIKEVGTGNTGWIATSSSQSPEAVTGTTYTFTTTDVGKAKEFSNAAAQVATIPLNTTASIPVGAIINLFQAGVGQVTLAPAAGVTIRTDTSLNSAGQYSSMQIRKRATDEWVLIGDTAASGRTVTASTTITDSDQTVIFNSASAVSQALPAVTAVTAYKKFDLTNINAGVVTFTDTISGTANRTLAQWSTLTVYSNGSVWIIA